MEIDDNNVRSGPVDRGVEPRIFDAGYDRFRVGLEQCADHASAGDIRLRYYDPKRTSTAWSWVKAVLR